MTDSRDLSRDLNQSISRFYDDYHRGRERSPNWWILKHYWPNFVGSTLEVGGGTLYPEHTRYYLSDLSAEAARRALAHGFPAVVSDGGQLPFRNQAFDTVACHDVLEHVTQPQDFLAELCRVARKRVIIAGPNYVGLQPGHLDRRLPGNLGRFLFGDGRATHRLDNPHLTFDAQWAPDKDAVTAANGGWVAEQMKAHGLNIRHLRTWEYNHHWLNLIPAVRCLGPFMFVVGERAL
jgi:SAM-dependent methyltransferase